jgi:protein phosphatase PTC1
MVWPEFSRGKLRRTNSADPQYLLDAILTQPDQSVPDLLNRTFHVVDSRLSHLAQTGKTQSGCTAVTAFLRVEHLDADPKGFINPGLSPRGLMEGRGEEELEQQTSLSSDRGNIGGGSSGGIGRSAASANGSLGRKTSGKRIRDLVGRLTGTSGDKKEEEAEEEDTQTVAAADGSRIDAIESHSSKGLRRVLYTANVGDARAVLW